MISKAVEQPEKDIVYLAHLLLTLKRTSVQLFAIIFVKFVLNAVGLSNLADVERESACKWK